MWLCTATLWWERHVDNLESIRRYVAGKEETNNGMFWFGKISRTPSWMKKARHRTWCKRESEEHGFVYFLCVCVCVYVLSFAVVEYLGMETQETRRSMCVGRGTRSCRTWAYSPHWIRVYRWFRSSHCVTYSKYWVSKQEKRKGVTVKPRLRGQ